MFQNVTSNELISHPKGFVFALILYVLKSVGLSFKVSLFILILFVDFVLLLVSRKLTNGLIIYLIAYFLIQWNYAYFSTSAYLIRQSLSLSIGLYGYFLVNHKNVRIFLIILSVLVHPISLVLLFALLCKRIKIRWLVMFWILIVLRLPRLFSDLQIPVDMVEINQMHRLIAYLVIASALVLLWSKQDSALAMLVYSFAILMSVFYSFDLIFYRVVLASYFVVFPAISIFIINGFRNLYFKLQ